MSWLDLRGEIAEELVVFSTMSDERIEWYEQRRLTYKGATMGNYRERKRTNKEWTRRRRLERREVQKRPRTPPYCQHCFQSMEKKYKGQKYCCRDHRNKASSTCFHQWSLPDGDDESCLRCDRHFKYSLHAPDNDFCSSICRDKLMCGEWVSQTGPCEMAKETPLPQPLPRGPDPLPPEPKPSNIQPIIVTTVNDYCWECGKWDTLCCYSCTKRRLAS